MAIPLRLLLKLPAVLPKARRWLRQTVAAHAASAKPIDPHRHPRIASHFPAAWLQRVRIVLTDHPPRPPLEAWGLAMERGFIDDPAGIALQDTVFLLRGRGDDLSLLAHELVHVVQWETLGVKRFLTMYGLQLVEHGYHDHPLERMARDLQSQFDAGRGAIDLAGIARRRTQEEFAKLRRSSLAHRIVFAMMGAG